LFGSVTDLAVVPDAIGGFTPGVITPLFVLSFWKLCHVANAETESARISTSAVRMDTDFFVINLFVFCSLSGA
jgi:hypothetical protein